MNVPVYARYKCCVACAHTNTFFTLSVPQNIIICVSWICCVQNDITCYVYRFSSPVLSECAVICDFI